MAELSFAEAQTATQSFKQSATGTTSILFTKQQVKNVMDTNGAEGFRAHKFNDNGKENLLLSPVDSNGDDINIASYQSGRPCPTICGNNGLNE